MKLNSSKIETKQLYIPYARRPKNIDEAIYARGKKVSKKVFDDYHNHPYFIPFVRRPKGITDDVYAKGKRVSKKVYEKHYDENTWGRIPYKGKRKKDMSEVDYNIGRRIKKDSKTYKKYLIQQGLSQPPQPPPVLPPPLPPKPSSRFYILSEDKLIDTNQMIPDYALKLREFLKTVITSEDSEVELSYLRINGKLFTHTFKVEGTINQVWKQRSTYFEWWTVDDRGENSYLTPWNLDYRDHGRSSELTVTIRELVKPDHTEQSYKRDVLGTHQVFNCLISPIKATIETDLQNIQIDINQCTQKTKRHTLQKRRSEKTKLIKVADELLEKYGIHGVPEKDLQSVANSLCMTITVKNLRNQDENVAIFDRANSKGSCWGAMKFVNTEIDHVEVITMHDTVIYGKHSKETQEEFCLQIKNQDEMQDILSKCKIAFESDNSKLYHYMETRNKIITVIGTCHRSYKFVPKYAEWRNEFIDNNESNFIDAKGNSVNYKSLGINTKDELSSNVARMGYHVTSGFDFNYDRKAVYYCVDDNDNITHITLEVEDTNTTPVSNGEVLLNGSMTKKLEYDGPLILEALMDAFPDTEFIPFRHFDQEKAYTQFKKAPIYQAFPQNLSEHGLLHEVDDVEEFLQLNVGMYKASSVDFTDVNITLRSVIYKMYFGVPEEDMHKRVIDDPKKVLTSAEWLYFISVGADVDLEWGAWGPIVEFEFGKDSHAKTESGTPFYSHFSGGLAAVYEEMGVNVPCNTQEMAAKQSKRGDKVYWNSVTKVATIQVKVDNVTHNTHLSAFINGYQRLNTLNQISKSGAKYDDVIRVVMDGIYIKSSSRFKAVDTFRPEPKQLKGSTASEMISSNNLSVDTSEWVSVKNAYWKLSAISGAGGDGKTTGTIRELKKQFTRVGFTAQAKELVSSKQVELGLDPDLCHTWHHLIGIGTDKKAVVKYPTVLFADECGQISQSIKEQLINALPHTKIVFAGDFDPKYQKTYQLEAITSNKGGSCRQDSMMNLEGMEHIENKNKDHEFDKNFRCTDKELWGDLGDLRKMQRDMWEQNFTDSKMTTAWMRKKLQSRTRTKSRLNRDYKPSDLIVTSRKSCKTCDNGLDHAVTKKPCTAFCAQHTRALDQHGKDKRWVCTKNGIDGVNGQIKIGGEKPGANWELRHASTINSVQGRTVEEGRALYIDPRKLFTNSHVYTMMSRVKSYDQLRMIHFNEEKVTTVPHTIHDRAIAELRKRLLSGDKGQFSDLDFDNVVIEYPVTGVPRRVDLMLLKNLHPVHAIEVHSTNPVTKEKAEDLAKAGISFTEVHATDIIGEKPITCVEEIDMDAIKGHVPQPKHEDATNKLLSRIEDGKITTNYERKYKGIGRLYPEGMGLTYINKRFRNLAASKLYTDVDMENAHPMIMSQYAVKHGIANETIGFYCKNREEVLSTIQNDLDCERDDAKRAVLKVLYGGGVDERCGLLQKFKDDTDQIAQHLNEHEPKYLEYVSKRYVCANKIKRASLSVWAQTIESQLLMSMYEYATDNGLTVGALIFDGMLIKNHRLIDDDMLRGMEHHVSSKTGYTIKLAIKPFDKIPDTHESDWFDDFNDDDCESGGHLPFLVVE